MSEPFIPRELLELLQLASGADYIELVLHNDSGERAVDFWHSDLPRLELQIVEVPSSQAEGVTGPDSFPWVAVPITGPSAETGWIAACRSDFAPLADNTAHVLSRAVRIVEQALDRAAERTRLSELGELLRSNQDSLRSARDQLELSNRELEQFAYIAAHELVAPLRAVAVYAEILETVSGTVGDDRSGAENCVSEIRAGVQHMTRQVQYLLQLSQTQLDTDSAEPIAVDMVVRAAIDSIEMALTEVDAIVTVGELPTVLATSVPLQSVFANLLTNAIRYRRPDHQLTIDITSFSDDDGHCIEVVDNGAGVAASDQVRIFEMFERASTAAHGSGIGLALSRKILEVFGGTLSVRSTASPGSAFQLRFPHIDVPQLA